MSIKFFGQFLLGKQLVTPEQLIEAVEYQESRNLRFGEYALSKGYLKAGDIQRIQAEQKRSDMFFGEVAVALDILTSTGVQELLTMQRNDHVHIGNAIVEKGFITPDVLERELALFNDDQSKYALGEVAVPAGVKDPETVRDIVDLTRKMFRRVAGMEVKVGEGFISDKEPIKSFATVSVRLNGSRECRYILSSSFEVSRAIAFGIMGKAAAEEPEEIISDAVKEFCNITCGNVIARLAKRGQTVGIHPPEEAIYSADGYNLLNGRKAVYYPLVTTTGEVTLILVE